jgi:hypothetical protein
MTPYRRSDSDVGCGAVMTAAGGLYIFALLFVGDADFADVHLQDILITVGVFMLAGGALLAGRRSLVGAAAIVASLATAWCLLPRSFPNVGGAILAPVALFLLVRWLGLFVKTNR